MSTPVPSNPSQPKRISSRTALAGTLGVDTTDLEDMRYKPTRTACAIYATETHYYAAHKAMPKDQVGKEWKRHPDQFWAEKAGTVIWVCEAE